jgi:hypothetical protein
MASRGAKGGKKAAKTYERPGLSDEEIEEIKEAFNLFDTDGSGKCCVYIRDSSVATLFCLLLLCVTTLQVTCVYTALIVLSQQVLTFDPLIFVAPILSAI